VKPLNSFQALYAPENSLTHSQELSICPYLESDKPSPHHPIQSKIHLNIIHPLRLGLSNGLFPSGVTTNRLHSFSLPRLFHPPRLDHSNLFNNRQMLCEGYKNTEFMTMQVSTVICYFIFLSFKYCSEHLAPKPSESTVSPLMLTHMQNSKRS
jgi:hypothetical protein